MWTINGPRCRILTYLKGGAPVPITIPRTGPVTVAPLPPQDADLLWEALIRETVRRHPELLAAPEMDAPEGQDLQDA